MHRAFSLIELLVVIAIVALLVSILLPALAAAREAARWAVCSSNVHQMQLSMLIYSNDYKETLPYRAWEFDPLSQTSGATQPWYLSLHTVEVLSDGYGMLRHQRPDGLFEHPQLKCPHAPLVPESQTQLKIFSYGPSENPETFTPRDEWIWTWLIPRSDYSFVYGMLESHRPLESLPPNVKPLVSYVSVEQRHMPASYKLYQSQPDHVMIADSTFTVPSWTTNTGTSTESGIAISSHARGDSRAMQLGAVSNSGATLTDFQKWIKGVNRASIDGAVQRVQPQNMGFNDGPMIDATNGCRVEHTWGGGRFYW